MNTAQNVNDGEKKESYQIKRDMFREIYIWSLPDFFLFIINCIFLIESLYLPFSHVTWTQLLAQCHLNNEGGAWIVTLPIHSVRDELQVLHTRAASCKGVAGFYIMNSAIWTLNNKYVWGLFECIVTKLLFWTQMWNFSGVNILIEKCHWWVVLYLFSSIKSIYPAL